MKNKVLIVLLLFAFVFGLECKGQYNGDKSILYGTVRADGYQTITKGAFWKQRPEAKQIYEGLTPSGYTVYILEKQSFGRFIDREHNNNDKNYIIFPVGAIVYTDNITGRFYSAVCGNEIEYLGPVERFIVKEKIVVQQQPEEDWRNYKAPPKDNVSTQLPPAPPLLPAPKGKTWVGKNLWWIIPVGVIVLGGSGYLIFKKPKPKPPTIEPRTMPPGIPAVPVIPTPGVPADPRGMPPGSN
jgi:hypothetical protein